MHFGKHGQWDTVLERKLGFLIFLLVIYCTGFSASKIYRPKGEKGVSEFRFPEKESTFLTGINKKKKLGNPNWCKIFIPS